jgi:hypothetical protein
MPDLALKFFMEDLTPEESEALEKVLETSEDAAWRFGKAAEKAYYRYGFSKPHWPGLPDSSHGPKPAFKPWVGGFCLIAVAAGILWIWTKPPAPIAHFLQQFQKHATLSPPRSKGMSVTPQHSGIAKEKNGPLASIEGTKASLPHPINGNLASPKAASALPQTNSSSVQNPVSPTGVGAESPNNPNAGVVSPNRVKPVLTPINLEEAPSKSFSNLSVRINQAEPGFITVRVIDMRGILVTPLYQGNLAAGRWVFEWDGKLGNGQKAAKGFYQIEVMSGSFVQRQNIEIH